MQGIHRCVFRFVVLLPGGGGMVEQLRASVFSFSWGEVGGMVERNYALWFDAFGFHRCFLFFLFFSVGRGVKGS